MGAWDTGSFDNDDAGDWAWELAESGTAAIESALDIVAAADDYIEAPDGSRAIAAAEVVAAGLGRPTKANLPDDVATFLAGKPVFSAKLVELARNAVARVLADDSELRELWAESDAFDEWMGLITDLQQRLNG